MKIYSPCNGLNSDALTVLCIFHSNNTDPLSLRCSHLFVRQLRNKSSQKKTNFRKKKQISATKNKFLQQKTNFATTTDSCF